LITANRKHPGYYESSALYHDEANPAWPGRYNFNVLILENPGSAESPAHRTERLLGGPQE